MKKKLDVYLIYLAWFVNLIYHFCGRVFGNYCNTHTISMDENGYPILGKIKIFADIQDIAFNLLYILIILYVIIVVIQMRRKMPVNLKKNILLSLILVLIDFIDFGFMINSITIQGSLGLKFLFVVLITNGVLYIIYKDHVQKGIIQF